jgi:hypothetical protein
MAFARLVLAENLADLLGKSFATGRWGFFAELLWLRQIRTRALFLPVTASP